MIAKRCGASVPVRSSTSLRMSEVNTRSLFLIQGPMLSRGVDVVERRSKRIVIFTPSENTAKCRKGIYSRGIVKVALRYLRAAGSSGSGLAISCRVTDSFTLAALAETLCRLSLSTSSEG